MAADDSEPAAPSLLRQNDDASHILIFEQCHQRTSRIIRSFLCKKDHNKNLEITRDLYFSSQDKDIDARTRYVNLLLHMSACVL